MAQWKDTGGVVDYAPVGDTVQLVEGSQISYDITCESAPGVPEDITHYTFSATIAFKLAAGPKRPPYQPLLANGVEVPSAMLAVRKADQSTEPGVVFIDFPANLLPAGVNVAPNAAAMPIGLVAMSVTSDAHPPVIDIVRFPVQWRDEDGE